LHRSDNVFSRSSPLRISNSFQSTILPSWSAFLFLSGSMKLVENMPLLPTLES
jgi:hypothetical protein